MGRRLKSKIPTTTTLLTPESNISIKRKLEGKQLIQKSYYDRQTRCLPEIHRGERVRIQRGNEWQPAVIVSRHEQPRSFIVQTPDGRTYRRNRKHLLKTGEKEFATPTADTNIYVQPDATHSKPPNAESTEQHVQDDDALIAQTESEKTEVLEEHFTRSGRLVKMPARYRN